MNADAERLESPTTRERLEGRVMRLLSALPGHWLLRLIGDQPLVVDGQVLDGHVQFIIAARRHKPQQLLSAPTPVEGRARYRREVQAVAESSGIRPARVHSVRQLEIETTHGRIPARHYTPLTGTADVRPPLLVYLHGGGFVLGDLDTHDEPCRMLCHHGQVQVLNIAYRCAPEHPFPAALDDVYEVMQWAQQHADALGADPARVCIGGDSAGANLAAVTALQLAREGRAPAAQLLIYPTTDFTAAYPSKALFGNGFMLTTGDMDAFCTLYLGDDPSRRSDPRASPALSPDLGLSPPTLITTAAFDPLRDEGEVYASSLAESGVFVRMKRMERLVHGYVHMTTVVPAAHAALVETAALFRGVLRDAARERG